MTRASWLLPWVLLARVTMLQCQDGQCRAARGAAMPTPMTVMTFKTHQACEAHRQRLEAVQVFEVQSPSRPGLTIRRETTYACQEGVTR